MKWKVSWLKSKPNQEHEVDETLKFDAKMFNKVSNIHNVSDIKVKGIIFLKDNIVNIDLEFSGIMELPCVNTNEIGEYPFTFRITDVIDEDYNEVVNYEADYIDLLELTWQRLIVEAPTRFVKKENQNKSGKSWQVMSEQDYLQRKDDKVDSRLAILKDLFKDDKED